MGARYTYSCPGCRYSANVSGEPDRGFVLFTRTGFCSTCNELVDYATDPSPDHGLLFYDLEGQPKKDGICPRCENPVMQEWHDGDPCPRCNAQFAPRVGYLMWD